MIVVCLDLARRERGMHGVSGMHGVNAACSNAHCRTLPLLEWCQLVVCNWRDHLARQSRSIATRLQRLVPGIGPGSTPLRTHESNVCTFILHILAASGRVNTKGQLSLACRLVRVAPCKSVPVNLRDPRMSYVAASICLWTMPRVRLKRHVDKFRLPYKRWKILKNFFVRPPIVKEVLARNANHFRYSRVRRSALGQVTR
jgi:hypothetical protein